MRLKIYHPKTNKTEEVENIAKIETDVIFNVLSNKKELNIHVYLKGSYKEYYSHSYIISEEYLENLWYILIEDKK